MAMPWRPASENLQSGSSCVTSSIEARLEEEEEEEEDQAPIFSLSKSSMDVLMAAGPPCKRDPAWTRLDLRRSSSTSTHAHQDTLTFQELRACMPQHTTTTNSHLAPDTGQQAQIDSSLPVSERWNANVGCRSVYSGSACRGGSTPETVIWRGGTMPPWSVTQEAPPSTAPDSPMSKIASPLATPSPFSSPLQTPLMSPSNTYLPSPLTLPLPPSSPPPPPPPHTHQQQEAHMPSPTPSPLLAPLSPKSPEVPEPTSTDVECLQTDITSSPLSTPSLTTLTSPSARLEERGSSERISPEIGCLVDVAVCKEKTPALSLSSGSPLPLGSWAGSPDDVQVFLSPSPVLQVERGESRGGEIFCHLELPWQPGQSHSPTASSLCRGQRSPLVSSLSDSLLDSCSRCSSNHSGIEIVTLIASPRAPRGRAFREDGTMTSEEGTMTSQRELVDAAVQTISPPGSWWNFKRHYSHTSSHSILGSPPGSRLNLRSSIGSHSNLVSPSSSMFPVDSPGEEEGQEGDLVWEVSSPPLHPGERRRSCLKVQGEERVDLGRRSSMKQVQWDEEGMTWDVYGASLDPLELSTAIQRHLNLKTSKGKDNPSPQRKKTKKKKATKVTETSFIATTVKVIVQEPNQQKMVDMATSTAEGENEVRPVAEGKREIDKEGDRKGMREEDACGNSKAEGEIEKEEDGKEEEEEVYREETLHRKSLSRGSGRSRTKSVMRSLKRPGWCGGSSKDNN